MLINLTANIEAMANALKVNINLEHLWLDFTMPVAETEEEKAADKAKVIRAMPALREALKANKGLGRLDVANWNMDPAILVQNMVEILKINKNIKHLSFFDDNIGPAEAQTLANALQNKLIPKEEELTSTTLDLSNNNIGVAGAYAFANALKVSTSLVALGLGGNKIGDAGAHNIANALQTNNTLIVLDLSNDNIGAVGARDIADALRTNHTLAELSLKGNKIGVVEVEAIADALQNNLHMRNIALDDAYNYRNFINLIIKRNTALFKLAKSLHEAISCFFILESNTAQRLHMHECLTADLDGEVRKFFPPSGKPIHTSLLMSFIIADHIEDILDKKVFDKNKVLINTVPQCSEKTKKEILELAKEVKKSQTEIIAETKKLGLPTRPIWRLTPAERVVRDEPTTISSSSGSGSSSTTSTPIEPIPTSQGKEHVSEELQLSSEKRRVSTENSEDSDSIKHESSRSSSTSSTSSASLATTSTTSALSPSSINTLTTTNPFLIGTTPISSTPIWLPKQVSPFSVKIPIIATPSATTATTSTTASSATVSSTSTTLTTSAPSPSSTNTLATTPVAQTTAKNTGTNEEHNNTPITSSPNSEAQKPFTYYEKKVVDASNSHKSSVNHSPTPNHESTARVIEEIKQSDLGDGQKNDLLDLSERLNNPHHKL